MKHDGPPTAAAPSLTSRLPDLRFHLVDDQDAMRCEHTEKDRLPHLLSQRFQIRTCHLARHVLLSRAQTEPRQSWPQAVVPTAGFLLPC
jgi:hypothetical protein